MSTKPATTDSKPILRVLGGEAAGTPPIWLMRQAGRYLPEYRKIRAQADSFLELCYTPALATEITLQPIRRFDLDAAILFSDILVVPHALGQEVWFVEGQGPKLRALDPAAGLAALSTQGLQEDGGGLLAPVYETVSKVRAALPNDKTLIGFAGGPWTVAAYMVEGGASQTFQNVKRWAFSEAGSFSSLIDLLVEATVLHLSHQVEAGAEVVQLFESHAGVLPEREFRRRITEPSARIVSGLHARFPDLPIIGFPRGAGALYEVYARETGVTALGLDSSVPAAWARHALGRTLPLQGNLDPVHLLAGGDTMIEAAAEIVATLGSGPLIFNLGHGVIKETPPEHVAALVAFLRGGSE
jgi:uroporphyrinogen decarboxylase